MKKIAYYNEEIEKVALNAQKARRMAKEVGLVADGNWKWGLRNMRNMKTGDVLKGKELSEAKKKLGSLSNNSYQQLKSSSRKLPPQTEIAGIVRDGNIKSTAVGELRGNMAPGKIGKADINMHTHPYSPGEKKFEIIQNWFNDMEKSNKSKGGIHSDIFDGHHENLERFIGDPLKGDFPANKDMKRNHLLADPSGGMVRFKGVTGDNSKKARLDKYTGNKRIDLSNDIDNRGIVKSKPTSTTEFEALYGGTYSDIESMINAGGNRESIVAPNIDVEGIHKVSPFKKRSIFFDRSPKKSR